MPMCRVRCHSEEEGYHRVRAGNGALCFVKRQQKPAADDGIPSCGPHVATETETAAMAGASTERLAWM